MKKKLILSFFLIGSRILLAQNINLRDSATLWIGAQASFFAGGNTTFNGTLTNNGTIVSFSDLDFVTNTDVGSLKFVGTGDQNLSGDTLNVVDIEVDKTGNSNVVLLTDQVIVTGMLNVTNGVIQADDELDLLVSGTSDDTGDGYVEGKLVGLSSGQDVTFPMGVNGFPNYLTLRNANTGAIMRVECQVPDPTILKADVDIQEISDEVEWVVTALNGATDATVSISFSGVDLSGTTYGEAIEARKYEPVILVLAAGDSIFRPLLSSDIRNLDDDRPLFSPTSGTIESTDLISISDSTIRLAIAWIPVVDRIEFFIPNTFAPNGTYEENRVFRPFFSGDEVTNFSMTIYNSLNSEVFSISRAEADIDLTLIGWNGRLSSGQEAPGGVYYYTLNLTAAASGFNRQESGTVLLLD